MTSKRFCLHGLLASIAFAALSSCAGKDNQAARATGTGGASVGSGPGGTSSAGGMGGAMSGTTTGMAGTGIIPPINGAGGGPTGDASVSSGCVNLQCRQASCTVGNCTQKACTGAAKTTVSGVVYDPAAKVPLYNVIVYVPNTPVEPVPRGVQCDRCASTAINPVVSALTNTKGAFVLEDVPVGPDVPIVLQVGKWRRQFKIPMVAPCIDTPLTDKNLTRLPRSQSEGDMPLIAMSTGGADSLQCLLLRMGIDPAEFTTDTGGGRVHFYSGPDGDALQIGILSSKQFDATLNGGATFTASTALWNSLDKMKAYDMVILSCEGVANEAVKPAQTLKNMYDYASVGGRVFASHWQRVWFSPNAPAPVPTTGEWLDQLDPPSPSTGRINTSFPKGMAMSEWLVNVGASTVPGELTIYQAKDNVHAVNPNLAKDWITVDNPNGPVGMNAIQYLSFNTPVGVPDDRMCGRAVFSDLHVTGATADQPNGMFPSMCHVRDSTAQEKALEFMILDLSSCVRNDDVPPVPPPPPPPPR